LAAGGLAELIKETQFGLDGPNALGFKGVMIGLFDMVMKPEEPQVEELGGSDFLLRVAALINCIGISALRWSIKRVSVVLVQGPGCSDVLALVPTSILRSDVPTKYSSRPADDDYSEEKRFVLVAERKNWE
jgi:hypothetical protein